MFNCSTHYFLFLSIVISWVNSLIFISSSDIRIVCLKVKSSNNEIRKRNTKFTGDSISNSSEIANEICGNNANNNPRKLIKNQHKQSAINIRDFLMFFITTKNEMIAPKNKNNLNAPDIYYSISVFFLKNDISKILTLIVNIYLILLDKVR